MTTSAEVTNSTCLQFVVPALAQCAPTMPAPLAISLMLPVVSLQLPRFVKFQEDLVFLLHCHLPKELEHLLR